MNVVDSDCVCSVIVLCAQLMDLSRHMVLAGGRLRPVQEAIPGIFLGIIRYGPMSLKFDGPFLQ